VIIVEECTGAHQRMRLGALLHSAAAGRVVTLSLDHAFATVYQRNRIPATNLGELVRVVKGLDSGLGCDDDRADRKPRVRGTRVPMVSGAKVRMLPEANEIHTPGAPGKEATGTGRASSRGTDGRAVRMNPKEDIDG
jgi:hypothetical protein